MKSKPTFEERVVDAIVKALHDSWGFGVTEPMRVDGFVMLPLVTEEWRAIVTVRVEPRVS